MARTGRPKTSVDVECTCANPECGKVYTVPEWQKYGRKYCSLSCANKTKSGRANRKLRVTPILKECGNCGKNFYVGGKGNPPWTQKHCSQECAATANSYQERPRTLTEVEAAWLAGLFDGEGSIIFAKDRSSKAVRITVTNTYRPLIDRVMEVVGTGSIIELTRFKRNDKHSPSWNWQCYSENARQVLQQILPWLIVKRERALLALGNVVPAKQKRVYTKRSTG